MATQYGHWKMAKERSPKSTPIVFALFRLFSLVFDRFCTFSLVFTLFGLSVSVLGRPFSHFFAPAIREQKRHIREVLLTVGSFLLTVELFYLQLTILAFLLTVGAFCLQF